MFGQTYAITNRTACLGYSDDTICGIQKYYSTSNATENLDYSQSDLGLLYNLSSGSWHFKGVDAPTLVNITDGVVTSAVASTVCLWKEK